VFRPAVSTADRSNEDWVAALGGGGPDRERALADLRPIVLRAVTHAVAPRVDRGADALAEDLTQQTLLHLSARLDQFRGEARFTTWAQKIAVRLSFSELRKKRWENVSLDALVAQPPASVEPGADALLEQAEAVQRVRHLVETELTDRQKTALQAVMAGMPLEEVARRMDTNRNALYKLLHDGRMRLKAAFEARGLTADDLLPSDS
jgi:RNA polymerase sigma-70 factor (ECF subfamily)